MTEKTTDSTEIKIKQNRRVLKKATRARQRKDDVVLERLTSIALKMREIRRKASQPKSVSLN